MYEHMRMSPCVFGSVYKQVRLGNGLAAAFQALALSAGYCFPLQADSPPCNWGEGFTSYGTP